MQSVQHTRCSQPQYKTISEDVDSPCKKNKHIMMINMIVSYILACQILRNIIMKCVSY